MKQVRILLAEFLGTFGLVFFGAGSILTDAVIRNGAAFGPADLLMIAFAHAIVLAVMITAVGHISGGHFNPAVTVAAAITRHIEPVLAGLYIVTQLVAGIVATALLRYIFPKVIVHAVNYGAPTPSISPVRSYVVEAVLTFFLVFVVFATAIDPRGAFSKIAGFGIGLVLLFDIIVGGPLTGAAMNPARAFGPALVAGIIDLQHFFIYWLGPLIGAVLAGLVYQGLMLANVTETDVPPPAEEKELA
ncbi:MAG: aquaporin [Candidatus Dormibacteraeota bacterium]|nr:aquaporin [Candidatus Dormibacteraeota bacterium]